MRVKLMISICTLSLNFSLFGQGQNSTDIDIIVPSYMKIAISGKSLMVECILRNNSLDDIYVPRKLIMNDFLFNDIGPYEIGAVVFYTRTNAGKYKKKNIRKSTIHYQENDVEMQLIKAHTSKKIVIEILSADINKAGYYKIKFQYNDRNHKRRFWSNWLRIEVFATADASQ